MKYTQRPYVQTVLNSTLTKNNEIYGTERSETLLGSSGNDVIYGLGGDDAILGMEGDDLLIGGKGNDQLSGGTGNDTYQFSKGDGSDIVLNHSRDGDITTDRIEFTDVHSSEIKLHRIGDDLIVIYSNDGSDQVLISDFFKGSLYEIDFIQFIDKELSAADLKELAILVPTPPPPANEIYGTDHSETLLGSNDNDIIYGLGGDDFLLGQAGDDLLIGGKGNDQLSGGTGNDTYQFSKGDGSDIVLNHSRDGDITTDRIEFTDVHSSEIKLHRIGDDLIVIYSNDGSDQVLISDFFKGSLYEIDFIQFIDKELSAADLKELAITLPPPPNEIYGTDRSEVLMGSHNHDAIYGLNGDDTIFGMAGDDLLVGGKGNDLLFGGTGNDTYLFSQGDGIDTIFNYEKEGLEDFDRIQFSDISFNQARFYRDGDHLVIIYSTDNSDQIIVSDFFLGELHEIDLVQFTDRSLSATDLKTLASTTPPKPIKEIIGSNNNDVLRGTNESETIYGLDGNDRISGLGGDDFLIGGKGDDRLEGGLGNDTYLFSKGDGHDEIINYARDGETTIDQVIFTDVHSNEATFYRQGNHLIIVYSEDHSDRIQLTDFFRGNRYITDIIQFTDRKYQIQDILTIMANAPNTYWGTENSESLSGTNNNDVLYGLGGDDRLSGRNGDDILIGGKGNDRLEGGLGNDSYFFSKGDGSDEIINYARDGETTIDQVVFTDVHSNEATFYRQGNHLIIIYSDDGNDRIQLTDFFRGNRYITDLIQFTDREYQAQDILVMMENAPNTYWGTENSESLSGTNNNDVLYGLGGNDRLSGRNGDDILIGGKGNDRLEGGLGNDTYLFSKGDGSDEVINYASDGAIAIDQVVFTDVHSNEARFERQGNHLIIIYSEDNSDRIQLTNYFRGDRYEIDIIQFIDQTYTSSDIATLLSSDQTLLLEDVQAASVTSTINQELHSMINAISSFTSTDCQEIISNSEISLINTVLVTPTY